VALGFRLVVLGLFGVDHLLCIASTPSHSMPVHGRTRKLPPGLTSDEMQGKHCWAEGRRQCTSGAGSCQPDELRPWLAHKTMALSARRYWK